jgi:glycosyltransferase involved in cell wall biosynthesis
MRILMAVPKYPFPVVGGLERQSHELARALVERGHSVHVVSSRFDPAQSDFETIDGVRSHRVKWIDFRPARFLLFPFGLARILFRLRHEIDIVHVHNVSWFGCFVSLFARLLGLPVITKLPNFGAFGIPGMQRRPLGFLRVALLKRSDAIIAMAPESVTELESIGYAMSRVLKVTNGVPLFLAPSRRRGSKPVQVVYVGRLSPEKGLVDLLHAWQAVTRRSTHGARLCMIGEGPQFAELQALASGLGIAETVEFFGYCDDVPAQLAAADLFVLPSYAEGNSNAVLEAMSAGLPIVATQVGGAGIQVGREGARFLVPPGDRRALADVLLELVENEDARWNLGKAMRDRVETRFAMDLVASIYEQAYGMMLSGRIEQIGQLNSSLFEACEARQCAG